MGYGLSVTGDAARSDYDHPQRWCLWCYLPLVQVLGTWRHQREQGPPVVACDPLKPGGREAQPAPEGMRLVTRHRFQ